MYDDAGRLDTLKKLSTDMEEAALCCEPEASALAKAADRRVTRPPFGRVGAADVETAGVPWALAALAGSRRVGIGAIFCVMTSRSFPGLDQLPAA